MTQRDLHYAAASRCKLAAADVTGRNSHLEQIWSALPQIADIGCDREDFPVLDDDPPFETANTIRRVPESMCRKGGLEGRQRACEAAHCQPCGERARISFSHLPDKVHRALADAGLPGNDILQEPAHVGFDEILDAARANQRDGVPMDATGIRHDGRHLLRTSALAEHEAAAKSFR